MYNTQYIACVIFLKCMYVCGVHAYMFALTLIRCIYIGPCVYYILCILSSCTITTPTVQTAGELKGLQKDHWVLSASSSIYQSWFWICLLHSDLLKWCTPTVCSWHRFETSFEKKSTLLLESCRETVVEILQSQKFIRFTVGVWQAGTKSLTHNNIVVFGIFETKMLKLDN